MKCKWHLCNNQLSGRQKNFCSAKCKSKYFVTQNRKMIKEKAVEYLGGKCMICGYSKCIGALEFDHRNPEEKEFSVSDTGTTKSWERVKKELDKCDLLCANCHRERHC